MNSCKKKFVRVAMLLKKNTHKQAPENKAARIKTFFFYFIITYLHFSEIVLLYTVPHNFNRDNSTIFCITFS